MISLMNKVQKIIFLSSIILTSIFLIISIYSYLNVFLTFGEVPLSEDFSSELIRKTGKSLPIFPYSIGIKIVWSYLYFYFFNIFFIPSMLLLRYFVPKINTHKKLFFFYIGFNLLVVIMLFSDLKIINWYCGYVLD